MNKQLTLLGHRVRDVADAETALKLFKQQHWDMVITDCNMPGMDGYQLTHAIRENERLNNRTAVPIIGFTANAMHEARTRCLMAGMDGCLFKPCTLEDVRRVIAMTVAIPILDLTALTGDDAGLTLQVLSQLQRSNRSYQEELSVSLAEDDSAALKALALQIKTTAQQINARFLVQVCEVVQQSNAAQCQQAGRLLEQALRRFEAILLKISADN